MRFRLNPVVLSLFCSFAHLSDARADALPLRLDHTFHALPESVQATAAFVSADRLEGQKDGQIEATGNVTLRQTGQAVRADHLRYSQITHELEADGAVRLEQPGSVLSGPYLKLNMDTHVGVIQQPNFYLVENAGRGEADVLHIQDQQHYRLENARYTTCPIDKPDWQIKMSALDIDQDRQIGEARHAWVTFKDVPILYSPWMDFPLSDRRKSGFLAPIFGGTTKGGTELTLPYYWNIAPNYDATFTPRIISKRGVQLNNEFRYLAPSFNSEVRIDVLPNDALANRTRARFALKHQQKLFDGAVGYVSFNRVADDAYFRDLADAVNSTSQVNLLQEAGMNYQFGGWNALVRAQRYQTLQDPLAPIAVPYARLPQISLNKQQLWSDAQVGFVGEFVDFSHPTALNAKRLVLNPSVSYPLINNAAFYVTPKLAVHSTHYVMGANNVTGIANASRTIPLLSVDSGMSMERDWQLFGKNYLHTLEPRAFYVFIPYQNQNALPNFDTAQADFSFTQMFTENRFFGNDRIGDANQVTLAMTSRLLDADTGAERFRATLGERISFAPTQVNLVAPTSNTGRSDILLALAGKVDKEWAMDSEFQFDPNQSHTQRYNIAARYRPEIGKTINFGYRFTRSSLIGTIVPNGTTVFTPIGGLRQVDFSAQWPLSGRWHAVGRWNYSLQEGRVLDSIGGLEYNQSCWTFRFVGQRFTTATQQTNTGFFVQLELNDLIKVGSDPLVLLKKSIPGYAKTNEKPNTETTQVLR
jgi:LPS-assembly protein